MDSLTQIALGSAVGVAVMGRRTAAWRAALWGGICGTLPDLDALIDYGDPVGNMVLHRADTHSLVWLTLAAPPLAWGIARLNGEMDRLRRWWLAVWAALVTHPLLDVMTVYGTQLLRPFTDHPYGVGSVFIVDPLYTLPLVAGVVAALRLPGRRGRRWNLAGLALSTAYLAAGVAAQHHVDGVARRSLAAQGIVADRLLVTPTAFNAVLWRVVAITPQAYHEGFRSLLDGEPTMAFERFERGEALHGALRDHLPVRRIARFSHGFFGLRERDGRVLLSDLRMGQEPYYVFTFAVARRGPDGRIEPTPVPVAAGGRPDLARGLPWLWRRIGGDPVPPPR